MRSCREASCIGWPFQASDQYCSWCGRRLVEVEAGFESKLGDEWVQLQPSVLNRERPPSLRLRVAHSGEAGHLKLQPGDFRLSAPWLELDYSSLGNPLKPGECVHFPVRKLKVPGPEDLPHEIRVQIGEQEVRASASLTFVPAPEFALEMGASEVVLASDSEPYLEAALVLRRGRVWLESLPRLEPAWARLELLEGDADPEELELDAVERPRLGLRFRFSQEELALLRQRSADQVHPLQRQGKLVFAYLDRGQKGSAPHKETLSQELPLSLTFILAPELYLEPFGYEVRRDWFAVVGLKQNPSFSLTIHNGPPGSAPRQDLWVQQLRVRDLDQGEEFLVESSEPAPWMVVSDAPLQLRLRLPSALRKGLVRSVQRRLQVVPVTNDPVQRLFHLRFQAEPADSYPGYLVVDLGTTATCAALVGETKTVHRLKLDQQTELPSATCYLKLVSERRWEVGRRALQRSLDPAAQRSVIVQAKRRVGDDSSPFEVVPLDEPSETVALTASQALTHLYREVLDQALGHLLTQNTSEVLVERMLVTHPSRFSLRQVELIRQAAHQALQDFWQTWTGQTRADLPTPLTLHEPIGAAFHYLRDWQNLAQVHQRADQNDLTWHLLVYDLGGGTLDCTLLRLDSRRESCEGGYAFQVSPSVVGATGERWFGGQDVTARLQQLVQQRLDQALQEERWPNPEQGGSQRVAWQRNQNLLGHWCEQLKLNLVHQVPEEESWLSFPGLTLMEKNRERLATASHWRSRVSLPSLAELEEAVDPLLQQSLASVREMLRRHSLEGPEVVLRVGKASQLPSVGQALQEAYPQSLHLAPDQLKGCVVEGACVPPLPGLPAGIQLSRGVRRPGVRFRWKPNDSYTATTCRLGLQILDSGQSWFQEVLPEGTPIPLDGLHGQLEGLLLEAGPNTMVFLENAGRQDALVLEGKPNPDIQELARCHIEVPALSESQMEQFSLHFELLPQGNLTIRLVAPEWEGLTVTTLDSSLMGRQY